MRFLKTDVFMWADKKRYSFWRQFMSGKSNSVDDKPEFGWKIKMSKRKNIERKMKNAEGWYTRIVGVRVRAKVRVWGLLYEGEG
jgi:hypothetical protein